MIREQIGLLWTLYRRPIQGASRIIDEGRIWFALGLALLALAGFQTEIVFMVRHGASSAVQQAHVQHTPPTRMRKTVTIRREARPWQ